MACACVSPSGPSKQSFLDFSFPPPSLQPLTSRGVTGAWVVRLNLRSQIRAQNTFVKHMPRFWVTLSLPSASFCHCCDMSETAPGESCRHCKQHFLGYRRSPASRLKEIAHNKSVDSRDLVKVLLHPFLLQHSLSPGPAHPLKL